jgi:hypothetical protein
MAKGGYKYLFLSLFILFIVIYTGCSHKENNTFEFLLQNKKIVLSLLKIQDSVFDIQAEIQNINGVVTKSLWRLNYPVFQFDCADITEDGIPEIAVGVIKSTRFDPEIRKRLFLFKLFDTCYVRPLWLGSRMSLPLVDFSLVKTIEGQRIRTIEQESSGRFMVTEYAWKTFGLIWKKNVQTGISNKKANNLLFKR